MSCRDPTHAMRQQPFFCSLGLVHADAVPHTTGEGAAVYPSRIVVHLVPAHVDPCRTPNDTTTAAATTIASSLLLCLPAFTSLWSSSSQSFCLCLAPLPPLRQGRSERGPDPPRRSRLSPQYLDLLESWDLPHAQHRQRPRLAM